MLVADEYLRNRASIAARNHFLAQLRVVLDIDFAELHLLLSEQTTGSLAVRAPVRDVQRHGGVGHFELPLPPRAVFPQGQLSFSPPFRPPCPLYTLLNARLIHLPA